MMLIQRRLFDAIQMRLILILMRGDADSDALVLADSDAPYLTLTQKALVLAEF